MSKRILIVDDEKSVAFFLGENLAELPAGYQVETACSAKEALAQMAQRPFDLVVTDLKMPDMNGLELMEKVRERHPHTRLILMTAYGNARVESAAYRLGACRYINKPFKIAQLAAAVDIALAEAEAPGRDILMLSDQQFDEIAQCLADLRFEIGAQCILLADVAGQMVAHVGETEGLELAPLISLIGGSFATSFEVSRLLGESQALTLNYHEGERFDVYSSNVDESLFLVLLFDKRQQQSRLGMVWLYTRRTLKQLQALVAGAERVGARDVLDDDFGALLSNSLDQLFVEPSAPGREAGRGDVKGDEQDEGLTLEEATARLHDRPSEAPAPPPAPAENDEPPAAETFSLEKALEMGLLGPSWMDGADRDD